MAQSNLGGAKSAACRIGISLEEYQRNREAGLKWCFVCKSFQHRNFFNDCSTASDGKDNKCKMCSRKAWRQRYKPIPIEQQKPRGFPPHPSRDGDKQQARNKVNREVTKGNLAHASTVACTDCGHLGSDKLHEYDHHRGYAAINHLEVQAVCVPCHVERERQRRNKQEE